MENICYLCHWWASLIIHDASLPSLLQKEKGCSHVQVMPGVTSKRCLKSLQVQKHTLGRMHYWLQCLREGAHQIKQSWYQKGKHFRMFYDYRAGFEARPVLLRIGLKQGLYEFLWSKPGSYQCSKQTLMAKFTKHKIVFSSIYLEAEWTNLCWNPGSSHTLQQVAQGSHNYTSSSLWTTLSFLFYI